MKYFIVTDALEPDEETDLSVLHGTVNLQEEYTAYTAKEDAIKSAKEDNQVAEDKGDRGLRFAVLEVQFEGDKGRHKSKVILAKSKESIEEGVYNFKPNETNNFRINKAIVGENYTTELDLSPEAVKQFQAKKLRQEERDGPKEPQPESPNLDSKSTEPDSKSTKPSSAAQPKKPDGQSGNQGSNNNAPNNVPRNRFSLLGKAAVMTALSATLYGTGLTTGLLATLAINAGLIPTGLASLGLGFGLYVLGSYTFDYFKDKRTKKEKYEVDLKQKENEVYKLLTDPKNPDLKNAPVMSLFNDVYEKARNPLFTNTGDLDAAANQPEISKLMVIQYQRQAISTLAKLSGPARQKKEAELMEETRKQFKVS